MTDAIKQNKNSEWSLWIRQVVAIMGVEIRRQFWGRRALLLYVFAAIPVFLMFMIAFVSDRAANDIRNNWPAGLAAFGNIYEGLILRTMIFFGCAWIFMNLFRGDIVDKSLHYYLLCPVKREVLVAGKYLSGLVASVVLFSLTTAGSLYFLYYARGYPANSEYFFDGPGMGQSLTYLGITALACVGYGAVFLVIGLFFRNPIVPALVVYGWEWLNFLLPPVLKKISIVHYLHTLSPIPMSEGPFATIVEATSPWISIPSMMVFTAIVLILASLRIRRYEINYGSE